MGKDPIFTAKPLCLNESSKWIASGQRPKGRDGRLGKIQFVSRNLCVPMNHSSKIRNRLGLLWKVTTLYHQTHTTKPTWHENSWEINAAGSKWAAPERARWPRLSSERIHPISRTPYLSPAISAGAALWRRHVACNIYMVTRHPPVHIQMISWFYFKFVIKMEWYLQFKSWWCHIIVNDSCIIWHIKTLKK